MELNIISSSLTLRITHMNNNTNRKSNCSEKLSDAIIEGIREDKQSLTFKLKNVWSHIKTVTVCLFRLSRLFVWVFSSSFFSSSTTPWLIYFLLTKEECNMITIGIKTPHRITVHVNTVMNF